MGMRIPVNQPIRYDEWEKQICAKIEQLQKTGLMVKKIVVHPRTLRDILTRNQDTEYWNPGIYKIFANCQLTGDPDVEVDMYNLQVSL